MVSFIRAADLEDVTEVLWADGPTALLLAGGTDLLTRPDPFAGRNLVVDISRVPQLQGIDLDARGWIRVGAGATHQAVADDPIIHRKARILALSCASVGSLQIRNRGTLGGNLSNASPAADSLPALACLGAKVHLVARDRQRSLALAEFLRGPGATAMTPDELVESIRFPARRGRTAAFFKKAGQRLGMCCAKATVALVARRHSDGRLSDVRVAMGAVAPTVIEVEAAAQVLEGRVLGPAVIREAARACEQASRPIDDLRSTADFRRKVVGALLTEGLLEELDHHRRLAQRRRARLRPPARRRKSR
jgi:CO/xanthine dehydrogenase FAD-binding subunit